MPRFLIMSLILALAAPASAQSDPDDRPPGPPPTADQLVKVDLVADGSAIRAGETFRLAVVFDIEPSWHIYWRNPGETGSATELIVRAPDGFVVGPVEYPRPRRLKEGDMVAYGYETKAVLFVPITVPRTFDADGATFEVQTFFLVCREKCYLGRTLESIELPRTATPPDRSRPGAKPGMKADTVSDPIVAFRARVPRPLADLPRAKAIVERGGGDAGRLVVTGSCQKLGHVEFFPVAWPGVTFGEPEITLVDEGFRLEVPLLIKKHNALGRPMKVSAVVGLGRSIDDPSFTFALPVR